MKRFIIQLSVISIFALALILVVLSRADGWTDAFYIRFTTPKQQHLILGTSRAAQAFQPQVLNELLDLSFHNYAFTIVHSPYGRVYYESIKRKHSLESGSVAILAVDPWSISSWCSDPNDSAQFRENGLFLDKVKVVDQDPNLYYLYEQLPNIRLNLLFNANKSTFLHDDGWLEISNIPMDSLSVSKRLTEKVQTYGREYLPKTKFSTTRLAYLLKTIQFLKQYGQVYLVRLPVHPEIMAIEDELMPDFTEKINEAIQLSDGYLDMSTQNSSFTYTDGNHLYQESGKAVSEIVGKWIKESSAFLQTHPTNK